MIPIDQSKLYKLKELQKKKIDVYPYTFTQTHHAQTSNDKYAYLHPEQQTKDIVSVAGRIMLRRVMGKAAFFHLQDQTGRIQLYFREDDLGQELYQIIVKDTDMGDIIGVTGTIFKTRTGEVTV